MARERFGNAKSISSAQFEDNNDEFRNQENQVSRSWHHYHSKRPASFIEGVVQEARRPHVGMRVAATKYHSTRNPVLRCLEVLITLIFFSHV